MVQKKYLVIFFLIFKTIKKMEDLRYKITSESSTLDVNEILNFISNQNIEPILVFIQECLNLSMSKFKLIGIYLTNIKYLERVRTCLLKLFKLNIVNINKDLFKNLKFTNREITNVDIVSQLYSLYTKIYNSKGLFDINILKLIQGDPSFIISNNYIILNQKLNIVNEFYSYVEENESLHIDVSEVDFDGKVYVPSKIVSSLDVDTVTPVKPIDNIKMIEKHWSKSIKALYSLNKKCVSFQKENEDLRTNQNGSVFLLQEEINKLKTHNENLLKRGKKSFIERDSRYIKHIVKFPDGEDLRTLFRTYFMGFESFALDAVSTIEKMGYGYDYEIFVKKIMLSVYRNTKNYVFNLLNKEREKILRKYEINIPSSFEEYDESVEKMFWYSSMQRIIPGKIKSISNSDIKSLMDDFTFEVYLNMMERSKNNEISSSDSDITIKKLILNFLEIFTYTELSSPKAYIIPEPGSYLNYNPELNQEIFSPGAKKYGQIKKGSMVEIVLPGLYFSNSLDTKPVELPLVRRLIENQN